MEQVDAHLKILLQDFVRLCPEDTPLEGDDWAGLHEICVFIHEQEIQCAPSTFRDFLIQHGCSENKATAVSQYYSHYLHQLKVRGHDPQTSVQKLDETPTQTGAEAHAHNQGATDVSVPI